MKTKKLSLALIAALWAIQTAFSQYLPQSEYLKNPIKNLDIVVQEAEFWKQAQDPVHGGFFCYVDQQGNPLKEPDMRSVFSWWYLPGATDGSNADADEAAWIQSYKANAPQSINPYFTAYEAAYGYSPVQFNHIPKSVIGNSRVAYVFTRAFMVTGKEEYLQLARVALDWLYAHGWDPITGGWSFSTDEFGTPKAYEPSVFDNPNLYKWSYGQIYPLIGITAITEATQGTRLTVPPGSISISADMVWLTKGIKLIEDRMFDNRQGYEGYFAATNYDWTQPAGKGFTPTVDGITTNAAAANLLLDDPFYRQRFLLMADEAVAHLVASMDDPRVKAGFAESYDRNWNLDPANKYTDIGHVLKTAWCLGRAYLVNPKPEYKQAAQRLISDVLAHGYDTVNGGPFRTYNWATGTVANDQQRYGYGKNQWMIEQAINAGLINYYIASTPADQDRFLQMADQSLDFFVKHMVDWTNGGVWEAVTNDGTGMIDNAKGSIWDQGYHAAELGYQAYLYGSLFYKKQPVTLYYHFEAAPQPQTIQLNPIEIKDRLHIVQVELSGQPFSSGVFEERTLILPSGVGGTFKVTFAGDPPQAAPVITSATTASAVTGTPFSYQITATNTPTSFSATDLPAGLSVNATGLISGTPIAAGINTLTLNATNAAGTGSGSLRLTVTTGVVAPPAPASGGGGGSIDAWFALALLALGAARGRKIFPQGPIEAAGRRC